MTPSLVSCVIGVFNGERYLDETLDSVFDQTHRPIEVIVADDGSTDGTARIARSRGSQVVYLHQDNAGHAAARNLGLSAASGEFVAFVDADDLWHQDKLERQLTRFRRRPELDVAFAHLRNFRGDQEGAALPGYTSVTMLARRGAFATVGVFDTSLRHGNDRDWFMRAAEAGMVTELLPDVLVRRRLHDANRSAALGDASRAEYLRILKASLDRRRAAGGQVDQYPFHSGATAAE